jgi:uncharacterized membrane protein YoaK (UPF0700 family)
MLGSMTTAGSTQLRDGVDEGALLVRAREDALNSALLSFVAAFVDTACFIGLFGLFTAHVTGNFVLIGAAIAEGHDAVAINKLLALPVFALSVAATAWAVAALRARRRAPLALLLGVQALLLGVAAGLAFERPNGSPIDKPAALWMGMLAVAAMAVQNALMRLALAELPPSTVMTGNVTQFVIDLVALRSPTDGNARSAARGRLTRMWPGIAAFIVGSVAAAAAFAAVGLRSLAVPTVLCVALAWRLRTVGRDVRSPHRT